MTAHSTHASFGIVVIGRNEGQRLVDCLASMPSGVPVVYVDSASTDDSVENAKKAGAHVVALDMSVPFSAARARNEGFEAMKTQFGVLDYIQFMDGDTLLDPNWLSAGVAFLQGHDDVAVVAGRLRERYPERSWFNQLCDIEWNTPVGDADAVGGIALYRWRAFEMLGGFDPEMVAGEEPELCYRLRHEGWKIHRLPDEMALHDAAITRFGAWWRRASRGGYAYAIGMARHGLGPEKYEVKRTLRALFWGLGLPGMAVLGLLTGWFWMPLIVLIAYGLKWWRMTWSVDESIPQRGKYAFYLILTNMAEAWGVLKYLWERLRGRGPKIVEYK